MTTMPTLETVLASNAVATSSALELTLSDGTVICIPWEQCSTKLAQANEDQRRIFELSPGGYGIHWPLLDEDLSVAGLRHAML
jgi:hypothetical protein